MNKFKGYLGMTIMILGFVIGIVCGLIMVINQFRNPDMTKMRLFIEYWDVALTGIISCIVGYIGWCILARS